MTGNQKPREKATSDPLKAGVIEPIVVKPFVSAAVPGPRRTLAETAAGALIAAGVSALNELNSQIRPLEQPHNPLRHQCQMELSAAICLRAARLRLEAARNLRKPVTPQIPDWRGKRWPKRIRAIAIFAHMRDPPNPFRNRLIINRLNGVFSKFIFAASFSFTSFTKLIYYSPAIDSATSRRFKARAIRLANFPSPQVRICSRLHGRVGPSKAVHKSTFPSDIAIRHLSGAVRNLPSHASGAARALNRDSAFQEGYKNHPSGFTENVSKGESACSSQSSFCQKSNQQSSRLWLPQDAWQ